MLTERGSCVSQREAYIKQAISDAVDKMDDDLPLMMQLCKIKEATSKAENSFDKKTAGMRGEAAKDQTPDPRKPKEVLIEQGISPNPGPRRMASRSGGRSVALFLTTLLATNLGGGVAHGYEHQPAFGGKQQIRETLARFASVGPCGRD